MDRWPEAEASFPEETEQPSILCEQTVGQGHFLKQTQNDQCKTPTALLFCRRRLIDDSGHLQAGDLPGILRRLPL